MGNDLNRSCALEKGSRGVKRSFKISPVERKNPLIKERATHYPLYTSLCMES